MKLSIQKFLYLMVYIPELTIYRLASQTKTDMSTIKDMKINYFAMLNCLYVESIRGYKSGGFGKILEVDEALVV